MNSINYLQVLILVLGMFFVIRWDFIGRNKVIPAATMAGIMSTMMYMIEGFGVFGHALHGAWQAPVFIIGATFLANWMQQSGAFVPLQRMVRNVWALGAFTGISSMLVDNTAATAMGINMVKIKKGTAAFATLVAMWALVGGAISVIGDVTTTMAWIAGVITVTGALKLAPAAFVTFLLYTYMVKDDVEIEFEGPDLEHERNSIRNNWFSLFIGLSLFLMVPTAKILWHIPPGLTIIVSAILGFIILNAVDQEKLDFLPHKEEFSSIMRTAGFILFVLWTVELMKVPFEIAGAMAKSLPLEIILAVSGFVSAAVDNIPWLAALLKALQYGVNSFSWLSIIFVLGIAGGWSNIGSTSSILAAESLGVKFGEYVKYAPKMVIATAAGWGVFWIQNWIGLV